MKSLMLSLNYPNNVNETMVCSPRHRSDFRTKAGLSPFSFASLDSSDNKCQMPSQDLSVNKSGAPKALRFSSDSDGNFFRFLIFCYFIVGGFFVMNNTDCHALDIERWIPERWDQVVGNQSLKEYFQNMIWCVRKEGHRSGFNMLVEGESRTGKTSTIRLGLKSFGCLNLDFETLNPCNRCMNCRDKIYRYGTGGWENFMSLFAEEESTTPFSYFFLPLDCSSLTDSDLQEAFNEVKEGEPYQRVVYLDECHRLASRSMDEKLLKPLEDIPAIWIASSAYVKKEKVNDTTKLDKMFQNRFTYRLRTEKPSVEELAIWLAERCEEWGIECECPQKTLTALAQRSCQNPGLALQVLNRAHKSRNHLLSMKLLDQHIFDLDD